MTERAEQFDERDRLEGVAEPPEAAPDEAGTTTVAETDTAPGRADGAADAEPT